MFKNQPSFINPIDVNTRNTPIIFCLTVTTVTFHYVWGPPSHRHLQRDPGPPHGRKTKPDVFTTRQCLSKLTSFCKCPVWSYHAQSLSDTETEPVSIWASIIQEVSEPLPIKLSPPVIYLQLPCLRISQSILVCVQFPVHWVPAAHLGAASLRFVHALQEAEQRLWIRLVPGTTNAWKALSEQITWKEH